jgi:putative ABC transport system permease protein
VDGVADISSLYVGYGEWLNLDNRRISRVQVYGFNPDKPAINLPEVNLQLNKLKLLNYVLQDRSARPGLGDVMGKLQQSQFFSAQVNRFQTKVCGLFTMGIPFFADGNLIVSDSTFLQLFPDRLPNQIDVGIIVLKQGTVIEKAQINLKAQLPNDVLVLTKEEFIQQERDYWERVNPIGLVFGFGTFVGFLVGTVIVYQILYSDVSDHLPEYATLKAIGYSDLYFVGVLFQEALLLGCIGFIFGFITTLGLYALIYQATLLPVFMSLNRAILVLALTLVMCTLSGALAIQKLQYADPADIF